MDEPDVARALEALRPGHMVIFPDGYHVLPIAPGETFERGDLVLIDENGRAVNGTKRTEPAGDEPHIVRVPPGSPTHS